MAGQGDGFLQPTKLIQVDDFMESIALPGYASSDLQSLAANTALGAAGTIFFVVPDGRTYEILDAGVTVASAEALDNSNKISLAISTASFTAPSTFAEDKIIVDDTALVANGTVGFTHSVLRGDFSFHADTTGLSNKFPAGTIIGFALTGQAGTTTTLGGVVWVRGKFSSNDSRPI